MPTYLYQCKCGATSEVLRTLHDAEDNPECVSCGLQMIRSYKFALTQFVGKGFASNENK